MPFGYHVRDCGINTNVLQARCVITSVNSIADRLKAAREALGLSQEELARAAGVSQGTIGNIESGTRRQPRELLAIAKAARVSPEWLQSGIGLMEASPDYSLSPAQPLSLGQTRVTTALKWEDVTMTATLPQKFELVLPDDSMAPRAKKGQTVTFEAGIDPKPGDGVLVSDAQDNIYLRIYRARRGGAWEAHAVNTDYSSLDSLADGLRVLAVLVGVQARWE